MTLIERTFRERIILVGVAMPPTTVDDVEGSLDELALLVDTAGADVVGRVVQRRDSPDPATYIGKGKAAELHELSLAVDSDTVVFDDDLTPAQQRNLEKILGRTAIDRTAVILDIFAQNARTQEGKAQVELALLRYRLPRLRGRQQSLSQQRGGVGSGGAIGNRGPGETQLEVDRRRLLRRMTRLEANLKQLSVTRHTQRKARQRGRHQVVSLVGYTNAGKSTLLNRLTDAGRARRGPPLRHPRPPHAASACPVARPSSSPTPSASSASCPTAWSTRSSPPSRWWPSPTSSSTWSTRRRPTPRPRSTRSTPYCGEIGAERVPQLLAFNKTDVAPDTGRLVDRHPGSVAVSALDGTGVEGLLQTIGDRLRAMANVIELVVPFERGDVVAAVHREGEVLVEQHEEGGTRLRARMDVAGASRFREFMVS